MNSNRLRIALSSLCGLAFAAFAILWIRSYSHADTFFVNFLNVGAFKAESVEGRLLITPNPRGPWGVSSYSLNDWQNRREVLKQFSAAISGPGNRQPAAALTVLASIPHWKFIVALAALGAAPWLRWSHRFSLRALLIVTTLVAAALAIAFCR